VRTASDIDRIRPEAQSIGQVAIGERPDNARAADAAGLAERYPPVPEAMPDRVASTLRPRSNRQRPTVEG
jgi:hypothetical protein